MPLYTYRCNECGFQFDQQQRMSDAPLSDCPICNGRVRRVVNAVGVVFKGSGFYITDSRNGKNASLTTSSSESTTIAGDKSSGSEKAATASPPPSTSATPATAV